MGLCSGLIFLKICQECGVVRHEMPGVSDPVDAGTPLNRRQSRRSVDTLVRETTGGRPDETFTSGAVFGSHIHDRRRPLAKTDKPNILVIWGDDIGVYNVSAYHRGLMGGSTPNIDRIAQEGVIFTDHYAQQSCTAGRASFIMGQHPFRTGMLTIGMPGSKQGIQPGDITIAQALKPLGYMTAQIGKNHLGDRNFSAHGHGFDEFYGNLYHLNSEEEPEKAPDYPKDPEFHKKFGPRGVLKTWATDKDDATEDPRWGRVGRQKIEDTGPLTPAHGDGRRRPAQSLARLHRPRAQSWQAVLSLAQLDTLPCLDDRADKWKNKSGFGLYADGMAELDYVVGGLLKKLDDLGIADNTIVVFSDRQRRRGRELARWRQHAVQGQEGNHVGRRIPRALRRALAGQMAEGAPS